MIANDKLIRKVKRLDACFEPLKQETNNNQNKNFCAMFISCGNFNNHDNLLLMINERHMKILLANNTPSQIKEKGAAVRTFKRTKKKG